MRSEALLLITLVSLTACSRGNPGWADVKAHCQIKLNESLKAPATAQYDPSSKPTETPTGWQWSSHVDAQNSFGANVRSRFTCEVTGKTWDDARISVRLE